MYYVLNNLNSKLINFYNNNLKFKQFNVKINTFIIFIQNKILVREIVE